jgi:chaperonin GroES
MLKPIEDKIVVKVDIVEQQTASGFVIAGVADEKTNTGKVLAKGPGIMLNNGDFVVPDVEVGDTIAFAKYSGTEIEHEGETLLILAYRDVLAVLG